jgi:hypothetical protein
MSPSLRVASKAAGDCRRCHSVLAPARGLGTKALASTLGNSGPDAYAGELRGHAIREWMYPGKPVVRCHQRY